MIPALSTCLPTSTWIMNFTLRYYVVRFGQYSNHSQWCLSLYRFSPCCRSSCELTVTSASIPTPYPQNPLVSLMQSHWTYLLSHVRPYSGKLHASPLISTLPVQVPSFLIPERMSPLPQILSTPIISKTSRRQFIRIRQWTRCYQRSFQSTPSASSSSLRRRYTWSRCRPSPHRSADGSGLSALIPNSVSLFHICKPFYTTFVDGPHTGHASSVLLTMNHCSLILMWNIQSRIYPSRASVAAPPALQTAFKIGMKRAKAEYIRLRYQLATSSKTLAQWKKVSSLGSANREWTCKVSFYL